MVILYAWLLADFLTGIFHWWEDRYLNYPSRCSFIESVRVLNDHHHADPRDILEDSYWGNVQLSAMFGWPVAALLYAIGAPPIVWLTVFFMTLGNLVHRFAHARKKDVPAIIRMLQYVGFMCSYKQHREHHYDTSGVVTKDAASRRYCVMSNWLNPVLDRVRFWEGLEMVFKRPQVAP